MSSPISYILTNGWKLKPSGYIAGTTIKVEGTVITDDDTEPTVPATTGSPVTWVFKVAYSGIITNVATGSGLSTAEHNKLMALPEDAGLTPTQEQTLNEIDINVESVKQTAEDNQGLDNIGSVKLIVLEGVCDQNSISRNIKLWFGELMENKTIRGGLL